MKDYHQGKLDAIKAITAFFKDQAQPNGYCSARHLADYLELGHVDALEAGSQDLANFAFDLKGVK